MLDESICHFMGVRSIFDGKSFSNQLIDHKPAKAPQEFIAGRLKVAHYFIGCFICRLLLCLLPCLLLIYCLRPNPYI